jgi:hypothetical protein
MPKTHYCADQEDNATQQVKLLKGKLDGFFGDKIIRIERIERTPAPNPAPPDMPVKGWRVELEE